MRKYPLKKTAMTDSAIKGLSTRATGNVATAQTAAVNAKGSISSKYRFVRRSLESIKKAGCIENLLRTWPAGVEERLMTSRTNYMINNVLLPHIFSGVGQWCSPEVQPHHRNR
jgi:hypothetical protein